MPATRQARRGREALAHPTCAQRRGRQRSHTCWPTSAYAKARPALVPGARQASACLAQRVAKRRAPRALSSQARRLAQQLVDLLLGEEVARTKLAHLRLRPRPACRCALELTHVEAAVDTYDVGFVAAAPACSERVRRTLDEQFEMLLPTGLVEKIGDLPRVQVILQTAAGDSVSEVSAHDHPREGAQLGDFLRPGRCVWPHGRGAPEAGL